jgi:hypothetical protein
MSLPGSAYHDFSRALFYGVLAATALTFIAPTIWRNERWQAVCAIVLLFLPSVVLFRAIQFILGPAHI